MHFLFLCLCFFVAYDQSRPAATLDPSDTKDHIADNESKTAPLSPTFKSSGPTTAAAAAAAFQTNMMVKRPDTVVAAAAAGGGGGFRLTCTCQVLTQKKTPLTFSYTNICALLYIFICTLTYLTFIHSTYAHIHI
jgi:hypothetical protein